MYIFALTKLKSACYIHNMTCSVRFLIYFVYNRYCVDKFQTQLEKAYTATVSNLLPFRMLGKYNHESEHPLQQSLEESLIHVIQALVPKQSLQHLLLLFTCFSPKCAGSRCRGQVLVHKASTGNAKLSLVVVQAGGVAWTGPPLLGADLKVVQRAPLKSHHLLFLSLQLGLQLMLLWLQHLHLKRRSASPPAHLSH